MCLNRTPSCIDMQDLTLWSPLLVLEWHAWFYHWLPNETVFVWWVQSCISMCCSQTKPHLSIQNCRWIWGFHNAKFCYQKTNKLWFLSTDVDIILDVRCFTMRKCAVSSPFCNRAHCHRRMHWPSDVLLWHLALHVENEWLSGSWVKMALKETHPSIKGRCQRNPSIHSSIPVSVAVESMVKMAPSFILHHWSTDNWRIANSPGGFPASDVTAAESDVTAANLISFAYGNHFKVGNRAWFVWWKTWTWKVWNFGSFCSCQIGVLWNSEYLVHQSLYIESL